MSVHEKPRPDRRRARRWNVMWPATLTIEGRDYACTILDLTERGARIGARGVPFGPSITELRCDRFGCLAARIRWACGAEAGLQFENPPAKVMQVLMPVVPGLGRRTKAADPPPVIPMRRSFGRLVRDTISSWESESAPRPVR